ncbi:MAG: transporter substrate-binding domain-containing protein [Alphaproteobacteria bacterium]|nr:transporter substrate-binding domain-containing protein [Alphaproteobacteria bacterium]
MPDDDAARPEKSKKKFKDYEIGYVHIDITEVRVEARKLYMFVGICRVCKFAYVELHDRMTTEIAVQFLRNMIDECPFKIHTILTDNGIQFTYELLADHLRPRDRMHAFDALCAQHHIDHRLTKFRHPWTNGQVEVMNRIIKNHTTKNYYYETAEALKKHLMAFLMVYNYQRPLRALKFLSPYDKIIDIWNKKPYLFRINPYHKTTGLNMYGVFRSALNSNQQQTLGIKMKTFKVILFSVLLALSFPAFAESVYDRVTETKTIRCGYELSPHSLMKDSNTGKLSGFTYDIFEKIGELNGIKIEWSEKVDYSNISQGLIDNHYDMFCGPVWPFPNKDEQKILTIPSLKNMLAILVRADDMRFDKDPRILNNPKYRLSVLKDDITDSIANRDFPKAKRLSISQGDDLKLLLINVQSGKSDAAFVEKKFAENYIHMSSGKLKNIIPHNAIYFNTSLYDLPENEEKLKNMIDSTLQLLIKDGYIEKIIPEYRIKESNFYVNGYTPIIR